MNTRLIELKLRQLADRPDGFLESVRHVPKTAARSVLLEAVFGPPAGPGAAGGLSWSWADFNNSGLPDEVMGRLRATLASLSPQVREKYSEEIARLDALA